MSRQATLKDIINFFGYKVSEKPIYEIEQLLALRDMIPESVKHLQIFPENISLKDAINESENFMNSHFKLHDISYINYNRKIEEATIIKPYELPIEKTDEEISSIDCFFSTLNGKYPKIYYKKIKIRESIDDFTSSEVTHEITHTQQESEKGIINYQTNVETLPILLEILHYIEKSSVSDHQSRVIMRRFNSLVDNISKLEALLIKSTLLKYVARLDIDKYAEVIEEEIISLSTYIESTLKALNLSDIYQTSNELIKKEIISYIQAIFSGNKSVEDFLEHYDTTFDSSLNQLQKKLKKMNF